MWCILDNIDDRYKIKGVLDENGDPLSNGRVSEVTEYLRGEQEPIRIISDQTYMLSRTLDKEGRPSLGITGFVDRPCLYEYAQGMILTLNDTKRIEFRVTPRIDSLLGVTCKSLAYWVEAANLSTPYEGGLPGQE